MSPADAVAAIEAADAVRVIDAGPVPTRYARGWHCLGLVREFADGAPHAVEAFGQKLVVFQTSSGSLSILNGYCPHMGGDLTQGTVMGDVLACPFHGWRWGGDGRCKEIPYARRVPPRARTRAWQALERNGQLFVWHDPQGNPPPVDVTVPEIEGVGTDAWTDWTWERILVSNSNCREIIDNVVDMAHFFYIHKGMPTYFKNVFEGHIATQYQAGTSQEIAASGADIETGVFEGQIQRSDASYFGPSYMIDRLWDDFRGTTVESVLINTHYPVSATSFVLMYGISIKKFAGVPDDAMAKIGTRMTSMIGEGFLQDVAIWQNKTRIDNPLLCEEDGPVYQLRRWYEQFYVDVEDVTPEMVQRFEFELDTSRAVSMWQQELVAARAAEA